ncbi:MAG: sugar ABC transporter [Desulfamplus sp.]|nr:sugar ABC transporter [Desulfamplus sp.]
MCIKGRLSIFVSAFLVLILINIVSADQKTILVIESYHAEYAWDASYKSGLEEVLGKTYKLEYFEMDTKRVPKDQHQQRADLAWEKYQQLKPTLVILGDDAALKFLGKKFAETPTPVVYLGINNNPRNYFKDMYDLPKNITGVLERPLLLRSIANLKEIIPNMKKIIVLFDNDTTAEVVKQEVFKNKNSLLGIMGIDVELKMIGDYKTWQDTVLSLKGKYDACVVGLYQTLKDADNKPVNAEDVINWTSKNLPIPGFAFWDFAVGANKTTGGFIIYGKDMGKQAADIVIQILEKGESIEKMRPISSDKGQFLFSKAQLKKWNIKLPPQIEQKTKYVE